MSFHIKNIRKNSSIFYNVIEFDIISSYDLNATNCQSMTPLLICDKNNGSFSSGNTPGKKYGAMNFHRRKGSV